MMRWQRRAFASTATWPRTPRARRRRPSARSATRRRTRSTKPCCAKTRPTGRVFLLRPGMDFGGENRVYLDVLELSPLLHMLAHAPLVVHLSFFRDAAGSGISGEHSGKDPVQA